MLLDKYDVGLWFMGDYDVSKTSELIRYHKISKSINKPENNSRDYLNEI